MQLKGLRACDGSEIYFETKHDCTEPCSMGSMARAGSEALPVAGRRPVPSAPLSRPGHFLGAGRLRSFFSNTMNSLFADPNQV